MGKTIWLSTIQEYDLDGCSIANFHNMLVDRMSDHIADLTTYKDPSWFNNRADIDTMMDAMHGMINKTIFDYIINDTNLLYGSDFHIRSILTHPTIHELLHPYCTGFVDVKMDIMVIIKHIIYVRCCEKLSQTNQDKTTNELIRSIRDIISHANSCISSIYYNKILNTFVAEHMMKSLNNNAITFNNVIHIKLTHDVSEYSFRYVMHMKPDISSPTMDDKTRRFYDKI